MKKIIIGFLLFGFICSVFTTPVPDNTNDPNYQDDLDEKDYAEYQDQNDSDESKNKIPIENANLKGTLERKEYYMKAKQGDTVELDCLKYLETNVLKENLVVIWSVTINNNKPVQLATGAFVTGDKNRINVTKNQNLIIHSVNHEDSGDYQCDITGLDDKLEVNAKLEVYTLPKVEILSNKRIVTGDTVNYKEHARIELDCLATGTPKPSVRWSLGDKVLENKDGIEVNEGNLLIKRASHHHSGDYQCLAENDLKQLDHGAVTIRINLAPRVKIHKSIVNCMEGNDRELHCLVHSNSEVKIIWEKNQKLLKTNEKYDIIQDKHHGTNRSVLIIKNITKHDLGVYQCKAQNFVGTAMANASLIFTPEPARFLAAQVEGRQALINWEIHSMLPLQDIILYYRKNGETPWAKETGVDHTRNETHGVYHVSHKLQLEPGVWETRVKSSNIVGESAMSEAEQFTVHSVIDLDDGENASGTPGSGSRLQLQSAIILFVALEIVRRLLFTYHQN